MDLYLFNLINQFALKWFWLDVLAIFCAEYLGYILIFCLIVFFRKNLKTIILALVSALLARFIVAELIYFLWRRARPFVENNVNLLVQHNDTASFPSGHAVFYFALFSVVFLKDKKTGVFFLFGVVLISLARVFSGIHWPSDILAGAVIGIFFSWLIVGFSGKRI